MRLCVRLSFCDAESIDKVDGWIDGWMGDMDWWICVNCGLVHACALASSQLPYHFCFYKAQFATTNSTVHKVLLVLVPTYM